MRKTEELLRLMSLSPEMTTTVIESRFEQIAKLLFESFAIQKGETIYLFKEIEFYFYNNNHRDVITHPRNSASLRWHINDFGGIDLNFLSYIKSCSHIDKKCRLSTKYILDDTACFGGILIRQLISSDYKHILAGPLACSELFRDFNAVCEDNSIPILIEHDNAMVGYIREPRINILTKRQKLNAKVDYILGQYENHPETEDLHNAFSTFVNKPYRFIRCETLMHDEDTNEVYFSPWLKDKKEGYPKLYSELTSLLYNIGIQSRELNNTCDYWARDYMPIQLNVNEFLKYQYHPDYLDNDENRKYITNVDRVMQGMRINCRKTYLKIDGGNMVACGPYVIMTDKVFLENNRNKNDENFKREIESELGHPIIIIPWKKHGNPKANDTDKYGYADGFIKWCGGNRILMGNHGDLYPNEAAKIREILESYGFDVTEMRFKGKVASLCHMLNWAYINFLQVGKNIIMPKFNIDEDKIAYQYIKTAFHDCCIHQIEMTDIAKNGGAIHCLSWNILKA